MRDPRSQGFRQDIPRPGLIDPLTRVDELLVLNINIMKLVLAKLNGQAPTAPVIPGEPTPTLGPLPPLVIPEYALTVIPVKIFDAFSNTRMDASTSYYPDKLADCREAVESLLIIIRSTCNQALTVQTIGSMDERVTAVSAFNIEASQSLAAASSIGLGVDLSTNWYPYLGVSITTGGTAPTSGEVNAWVYVRKRVRVGRTV